MSNEKYDGLILRCDSTRIKETWVGGRYYSVLPTEEIPNGVACNLGNYVESSVEIKEMLEITNPNDIYIVINPEINQSDKSKIDYTLGSQRHRPNKAVPTVKLQEMDIVSLSEDFLGDDVSIGNLKKGMILQYSVKGDKLVSVYRDGLGLKIVNIKNSNIPELVYNEEEDKNIKQIYKMIVFEVVKVTS